MKKQFSLTIASPCSENWDNFIPTKNGAFCKSCNKNVMDFRAMTDLEVKQFFQHKPQHICGRFKQNQLKVYSIQSESRVLLPGYSVLKAGILFLFMFLLNRHGSAQDMNYPEKQKAVQTEHKKQGVTSDVTESGRIIKGIVMDEDDYPLPGVNVYLKGSTVGTVTDINGHYEFPIELSAGDILCFSYIGFETLEFKVKEETQVEVNLHMMYYDVMGEVAVNEVYTHKSSGFGRFWDKVKGAFR